MLDFRKSLINGTLNKVLKRLPYLLSKYAVFQKMLQRGYPPDDWAALMDATKADGRKARCPARDGLT